MKINKENPWKTLSQKPVYEPWISLTEYEVSSPGGGKDIYGKVSFKNLTIGITPLDENNNTRLVGQYRYTLNEYSWEIPMGGGPLVINALKSAKRELKEETGITATEWEEILKIHASNSVTDEVGYFFLARNLSFGKPQSVQSESDLKIKKTSFKNVLRMAEREELTDSLSLSRILRLPTDLISDIS